MSPGTRQWPASWAKPGIGWQSSEAETELPGRLCGALEGLGIPALVRVVAQGRFAPRPSSRPVQELQLLAQVLYLCMM